jgi:hypothetical protein
MKIGQIAPLMESVPPRLYGGTERIVSYLTEELVRMGHEVTRSPAAIQSPARNGCAAFPQRSGLTPISTIPFLLHADARPGPRRRRGI